MSFLYPQTMIGTRDYSSNEKVARLNDLWAIGYVLGAIDAAYQQFGISHDSDVAIALATNVFGALYGKERGEEVYNKAVERQHDLPLLNGMLIGGNEAQRAMAGERSGIMGLGLFLDKGVKRKPE